MSERSQVETRTLNADGADALVEETARALRDGAVVLLPTETVYALVGRADDPAVVARLRAIKGGSDQPFARFVTDLSAVEASGAVVPPAARRLGARYWPGPLTLVLDDPRGGTLGFRVPGHAFTRRVVEQAGVPLAATSANRAGEAAGVTFAEAMDEVGEQVDLAVDDGKSPLGIASTVVRVSRGEPPQVLREGFLERPSIERALTRLVVFVCTGNTCRSPMAETLFRQRLAERLGVSPEALSGLGWQVASAGISAGYGGPAAEHAVDVMASRGLDLSAHQSQPVVDDLVEDAERIVALTPNHAAALLQYWPEAAPKVQVLDPHGVPDPVGGTRLQYEETADHIEARLDGLLAALDLEPAPAAGAPPQAAPDATPEDPRAEPGSAPRSSAELAALFPAPGDVPPGMDVSRRVEDQGGERYLIRGEVRRWEGRSEPVPSAIHERLPDGTLGPRRTIGRTAYLSGEVALEALDAAVQAWDLGRGAWPRATIKARVASLRAFVEAVRPTREEVARLLMWEVGKPWKDSLQEFDRTIEYVDATIDALEELDRRSSRFRSEGGVLGMVRRAPLGVVLCMGPFNYPFNETYTTVIPALAMGNTVVVKLPKAGMLCNLPVLDALARSFPPGVVNVISGDGAEVVGPLLTSGKVDVLAFIGSSRVAGLLEKQHPAPYRLTTILGMEAKNPAIVLPSADLDLAVRECVRGALSFNGQRCTALKLLFVHRSIAEAFVERLAHAVEALRPGMPWESGATLTPLPEEGKPAWLTGLIEDAVRKGARVVNPSGGQQAGSLFFPAVLYPVAQDAELFSVEQFGPLVPVVPFDHLDEVQRAIAESAYGQQASVFGQDPEALGPLIDALANQVCRINLNRQCQRGPDTFPFAGRKNSARGVLSVIDALEALSIPSLVATDDDGGRALVEGILEQKTSHFLRKPS